jgi:hypothetical protein
MYPIDNELYVYFKDELIATHVLSGSLFNYKKEHYIQGLSNHFDDQNQIEAIAKKNLEKLGSL